MYKFGIGNISFYPDNPLVIIAGPCVIESEDHCLFMADQLKKITEKINIPFIFKSSFLKANRSSIHSYTGPGLEKGLNILASVKKKFSIPITSDIHSIEQVEPAAEILDIIQIPAFLSRQTELIVRAAKTGRIINVKKGQFLAPDDVKNIIEKVYSTGNKKLLITERGTSFGYHNLVVDMRSFEIVKKNQVPVIYDATHSIQLPGGKGDHSGGQCEFIPALSKAAVAIGINGIFFEVHDKPEKAKSDSSSMLTLEDFKRLLPILIKIDHLIKSEN
jgi:2-dehydro-3-deoxyphosphooctonate aldolase (KDO 8-P synthase)